MSKAKTKVEETVEETVETKKLKTLRTKALLNSNVLGDRVGGTVKLLGKAIVLRMGADEKTQATTNKVSKASRKFRGMTEAEIRADEKIVKAMGVCVKNFGAIKDASADAKADFSDALKGAYNDLASYSLTDATEDMPDAIEF